MWIDRAYYLYFAFDFGATLYLLKRSYGANSHMLGKMLPKTIMFFSIRVFAIYQAQSYFST